MPQLDTNFSFRTPDIAGSKLKGMQIADYMESRDWQKKQRDWSEKDRKRAVERLKFKDESDALDYLYESAPMINYDNYEQAKSHLEELGLHPDLLPSIDSFGPRDSEEARDEFDKFKTNSMISLKNQIDIMKSEQKGKVQTQKDEAAMKRTEATQKGAMERAELREKGATERAKMSSQRTEKTQNRQNYVSSMNQILKEYGGSGQEIDLKNLTLSQGGNQAYKEMVRQANDTDPSNAEKRRRAKKNLKTYENLKKKMLALAGEVQETEQAGNESSWRKYLPPDADVPDVKHEGMVRSN